MLFASALSILSAAALAQAAVTPLTPSGAPEVGSELDIQWNTDSSGEWTDCQIDFMSGDNWNMINLETVATGIDCTKEDSLSWTVPDVTIYANVYFFQFTMGGDVSTAVWTTRFPIASTSGSTSAAPESIQPDGQTIGWGSGALANQASATSIVSLREGANNPGSATSSAMTASTNDVSADATASSSADEEEASDSSEATSSTLARTTRSSSASEDEEDASTSEEASSTSSSSRAHKASSSSASTSSTEDEQEDSSAAISLTSATGLAMVLAGGLMLL